MSGHNDDELVASKTEGYKLGEKKTVDEYTKLGVSCHVVCSLQVASPPPTSGQHDRTAVQQRQQQQQQP